MRKLFYATVAFIAFLIGLFLFIFASFTSCISNNELTPPEMSVDVDEITLSTLWVDVDWPPSVHKINVYGTRMVSFKSENEKIARVSRDGEVVGMRAGSTNIVVQGDLKSIKVKVNVIPRPSNFLEPLYNFTLTKKELLQQKGDGYDMQVDPDVFHYRWGEVSPVGEYYFFDKQTGLLFTSYLIVNKGKVTEQDLNTFFKERYLALGKGGWKSLDGRLIVQISEYDDQHYKIKYSAKKETYIVLG